MGRKRKSTSRKRASSNAKKTEKSFSSDLIGGILVVLGLVLIIFLGFKNIGSFAGIINNVLKGLFGYMAYILPATFIVVGIYLIVSEKSVKKVKQILKGVLIMSLISITVSSFVTTDFELFKNPVKYIVDMYNGGVSGVNITGVIGTIFSSIFVNLIGIIATRIVLVFVTLLSILLVFDISFKQLFYGIYNVFVYIINGIYSACSVLFRKDERKTIRKEFKDEEKRQKEIESKMKEVGSKDVEQKLKLDNAEQVEFDFNKLGGKPSELELQAKQQRDDFFKKQKEQKEDKDVKEVLTLDHSVVHIEQENYVFPSTKLLCVPENVKTFDKKSIHSTAVKLQKTLASFGVEAKVTNITKGPTVTRYELTPNTGVKVSKIVNLADDIALNLAAKSIRIEAPIPGKAAVGIEVPNSISESVFLREVIESDVFKDHKSKISYALGKDAAGEIVVGDIAKMPHTLIAGATGSGKSVCINALLVSILYKAKPSEVKLILIDPKMVELSGYNGIPHLLIPVVTDPKKAAGALNWAVQEMVNRYSLFAQKGVKDIKGYNQIIEKEDGAKLPQIVIIIDELADLMMVAPNDVEDAICRLAQMARAAGMHLVIATQRPSVDVITGIIKANIPSRIAFTVSSQVDSRTILDSAGAEKLLGKGDMLYFPTGEIKPVRIQGAFVSEVEIEKIVSQIKMDNDTQYNEEILESIENANKGKTNEDSSDGEDGDVLLNDAIDLVVDMGSASASMLQRRFKIGYSRAGRIVDQMEARGLISGYDGSKPRQVLISKGEWQELKMGNERSSSASNDENSGTTINPKINIEL